MRAVILVIAITLLAYDFAGSASARRHWQHPNIVATASIPSSRVDFESNVKPILQSKCTPCHFNGGQMYAQLPFDRPETVRKLGERLFTRITDENHRRIIREFLAQEP